MVLYLQSKHQNYLKMVDKCYKLGDVIVTPTLYSKNLLHGYKGLENKKYMLYQMELR